MSSPCAYRQSFSCPTTGQQYLYADDEELGNVKRICAMNAAQYAQRISEEKVKTSTAILATAIGRANGLMKQNTDGFAQTDRILAEAVATHANMTAYYKAEKEKYERDAADEQGALKRILAAAEQEKAATDAEITSCRDAFTAYNAEKEERAAAVVREQQEREAAAAEAATRRARELREHEAAARAQFIPAEWEAARKSTGGKASRKMLATKASTPPLARPATRSTTRAIITEQTKQALLIEQGGCCGNTRTGHGCGQKLPMSRADGAPRPIYDIDHIIPVSHMRWRYGGDCNNISNLQALCPNCHAIKSRHTDRGRVVG